MIKSRRDRQLTCVRRPISRSSILDPTMARQDRKADKSLVRADLPGKPQALVEPEIRSWRVQPSSVVLFFYFTGCVILLIRLAGSLWLTRLMKQTTVPVSDPAWTRSARILAETLACM